MCVLWSRELWRRPVNNFPPNCERWLVINEKIWTPVESIENPGNISGKERRMLIYSCQSNNFIWGQVSVEDDQFINLYTWVLLILICEPSSYNNPTVSCRSGYCSLCSVIIHLISIIVDPDPLSIVGSNVVQYYVGPSGRFGAGVSEWSIR